MRMTNTNIEGMSVTSSIRYETNEHWWRMNYIVTYTPSTEDLSTSCSAVPFFLNLKIYIKIHFSLSSLSLHPILYQLNLYLTIVHDFCTFFSLEF